MTSYAQTILPPREGRGLPRWAIAGLVVLAVHLVVGILIVVTRHVEMPAGTPSNAVMIDLAPVAAPAQPVAAPPQEPASPPQEVPPELKSPELPPPPPPLQTETAPPPVITPPPPALPILPVPEIPLAKPEAVIPPPPKPSVTQKSPEQKKLEQQKRLEEQRKEKERVELRKERAERARAERARAASAQHAGGAAGVSHRSLSAWVREVQARVIAAAPGAAGGETGTAVLAFTVDAGGRVVSAHIARSSGSPTLDRATLSIAHRLGHLPPPPNGHVTVRVPVRFSVR